MKIEGETNYRNREAFTRGCSVKKELLKVSQNPQQNTRKTKRLWDRCLPVNFEKNILFYINISLYRTFPVAAFGSSRPELSCEKPILKHFINPKGKHLQWSPLFRKEESLYEPKNFEKKDFTQGVFPVSFAAFFRTTIIWNTLDGCFCKYVLN